jgi:hypothetical protein
VLLLVLQDLFDVIHQVHLKINQLTIKLILLSVYYPIKQRKEKGFFFSYIHLRLMVFDIVKQLEDILEVVLYLLKQKILM